MKNLLQSAALTSLLLVMLTACSQSPEDDAVSESQRFFFLESLKQVQTGGSQLRAAGLNPAALEAALEMLDQGLQLAFQVEPDFLDSLDLRLGKNYRRWFVAGVENYRIGIEAGDESQQRKGLQLLARWAEFWSAEQQAIMARLIPG